MREVSGKGARRGRTGEEIVGEIEGRVDRDRERKMEKRCREPLREREQSEREGKERERVMEGELMATSKSQSDEVIIFGLWMPPQQVWA